VEEPGLDGLDNHQGEVPVLADDYGESSLAEALGIPQVAHPVVPVPDSQIPADSAAGLDMEFPDRQPAEDEIPATLPDDSQLPKSPDDSAKASPPITPTELEMTPQAASVIEVSESPPVAAAPPVTREEMAKASVVVLTQPQQSPHPVVATNGLPTSSKHSPEDLRALQEKIEYLKQLPWDFVAFIPFFHYWFSFGIVYKLKWFHEPTNHHPIAAIAAQAKTAACECEGCCQAFSHQGPGD
jgi:hypothetical protein